MSSRHQTVSVLIPTYHRPAQLRASVKSVVAQRIPPGWKLDLVIALSDPFNPDDRLAAEHLSASDPRVSIAQAEARGRGAARNAGLRKVSGEIVAFLDDDCIAEPRWLAEGIAALATADIVQGRTWPIREVQGFEKSLAIIPPSWLWETCNLFVRREWVDRVGGFGEHWKKRCEDTEWGWKIVRLGARPGFSQEAVVLHSVEPRTYGQYLRYKAGIVDFPRLFRETPEARRVFYHRYFVNRRHVHLAGAVTLALTSGTLRAGGRRGASRGTLMLAAALYLAPLAELIYHGHVIRAWQDLRYRVPVECAEFGAAVYGTLRWRRLLV